MFNPSPKERMIASAVAMVRPAAFHFNAQTAGSNAFQHEIRTFNNRQLTDLAQLEFDAMVELLRSHGIEVLLYNDRAEDGTPDSIFPNNWFSTFGEHIVLYSMFTPNRRKERKAEIYTDLSRRLGKELNTDLLKIESLGEILEGTGSLVCDHISKTAFAARSPRTSDKALDLFEEITGYSTLRFRSLGPDGSEIYHTNVMMCIADRYAVVGSDTLAPEDRERVLGTLMDLGKELIELNNEQVYRHFAGNMIQLQNAQGEHFLLMSSEARHSLGEDQIRKIEEFGDRILSPSIHMIERIGGGSVRCMVAELFKDQ